MNGEPRKRFEQFLTLEWYETLLRFIATFFAKTSELLLAGGLVVSTANFLTDGHILTNANAAAAWAWVQALALDSSLGISFYYVLQCLKQRDWVKFVLYLLLTGLLTLVAWSITNVDIFSHAIHTTMSDALARLGFDVGLLSTLRAIAVVGFVLMSRLKDVSFKDLYNTKDGEASAPPPALAPPGPFPVSSTSETVRSTLTIEEVALLFRAMNPSSSGTHTVEPSVEQVPPALPQGSGEQRQQRQVEQAQTQREPSSPAPEPALPHELAAPQFQVEPRQEPSAAPAPVVTMAPEPIASQRAPHPEPEHGAGLKREERLERVYQALTAEGVKISARALAERAHIHRSTCAAWLQARTGATPSPVPAPSRPTGEESDQRFPEAEPLAQGDGSPLPDEDASPGDSAEMHPPRDTPGHWQQRRNADTSQEER
jgi:hypothetical protein